MSSRGSTWGRRSPAVGPRVGLFGVIGTDNIGNEGCLDAVIAWLKRDHPDAIVDFMCVGPEKVKTRYGAPAIPMNWYTKHEHASGVRAIVLKVLGKGVDAYRVASWVRKHDAVIAPGAGVLEVTLPVGPWWYPYSMFLLSLSGRVTGTKVAMVSVGASGADQRLTRRFITTAAKLAFYRSYRDTGSYQAMRRAGVDVTNDRVYPDLVFALPVPPAEDGDPRTVGVGIMAYYGGNEDRAQAAEVHASYAEKMKRFVRWLADNGYRIRLFPGDNRWDGSVAADILADLGAHRPDLEPVWAVTGAVTSLDALMREMAPVGAVVGMRYHNVVCALKLGKPTLSLSYARKHDLLMADMGLSKFCLPARTFDVDQLIERFTELRSRAGELTPAIADRTAEKVRLLDQQFAELSKLLFQGREQAPKPRGARARRVPMRIKITRPSMRSCPPSWRPDMSRSRGPAAGW
jgi:polysaccharide pyruvyl transferase WcaK-like protein